MSVLDEFSEQHLAIFLHILHQALWPSVVDSQDVENIEIRPKYPHNYNKLKQYIKGILFY